MSNITVFDPSEHHIRFVGAMKTPEGANYEFRAILDTGAYVSHYEKHWGVDALIGLDFFRQFRVTIDYKVGQIITEPFMS